MNYVMVENDGELDPRLIELMGASTKDGVSTIGMFGTGWKYGIALALRKNIPVKIFSGSKKIEFFKKDENIGGTVFHRICYSVGKSGTKRTSLTTSMGQKDWDDDWYLLREVISNSIDCGGFAITKADDFTISGVSGKTRVYVGLSERLEEVINNMPKFVRRSGEVETNALGKLFKPVSDKCRIYKKGILVRELEHPGVYDYELNELTLSESRTSDTWNIFWQMRKLLSHSSVDNLRVVVRSLSEADSDGRKIAEASVVFSEYDKEKNSSWCAAFNAEYGEEGVLCAKSDVVEESIVSLGKKPVSLPEAVANALRSTGGVSTENSLLGAGVSSGFVFRAETEYEGSVLSKTSDILKKLFGSLADRIKIKIFKECRGSSGETVSLLKEDDGSYSIAVREDQIDGGLRSLLLCVIPEIIDNLSISGKISSKDRESIPQNFIEVILPAFGIVV